MNSRNTTVHNPNNISSWILITKLAKVKRKGKEKEENAGCAKVLRQSEVSSNLMETFKMNYRIIYLPLNCFNKEYVMIAMHTIVTVRASCVRL